MADRFKNAATRLTSHRVQISRMLASTEWAGVWGDQCRTEWHTSLSPALGIASKSLEQLGRRLDANAVEQRNASSAVGPVMAVGQRDLPNRFDDVIHFGPSRGGHDLLGSTLGALLEPGRISTDEIEIRALENGRFIVVLPGVTDLAAPVEAFLDSVLTHGPQLAAVLGVRRWFDNDEPTVRKMRYALSAAVADDTYSNPYSATILAALDRAGVPDGADVLLVGHSFGAYAAIDLAVVDGAKAFSDVPNAYRVNITHVVACGADTDWRFDELEPAARVLVLNNRWDLVPLVSEGLHRDGSPSTGSHIERTFDGGWKGGGHHVSNYTDWLTNTATVDYELESWLDGLTAMYGSGGLRFSAKVPDPNT